MKSLALMLASVCLPAMGQTPSFEVASVKPAAPPTMGGRMMMGMRGGPGTPDPTRYVCNNCSLMMLLTNAYDLKRFQIAGPSWLDTERFEITAKVPEGATKEQARLMMQSLLTERFGMKAHLEKKEMQVLDLVVAKGGPKLKEASGAAPAPPFPPPSEGPVRIKVGPDGLPELPAGRTMTIMTPSGAKHQGAGESMTDLASFLGNQLNKPVTDYTGLTGKYDFSITFAPEMGGMPGMPLPPPGGGGGPVVGVFGSGGPVGGGAAGQPEVEPHPTLQRAVQEQLGLRLEGKKGQADMLMIEHIEKAPTEN